MYAIMFSSLLINSILMLRYDSSESQRSNCLKAHDMNFLNWAFETAIDLYAYTNDKELRQQSWLYRHHRISDDR